MTTASVLDTAAIDGLRTRVRGQVVQPGDPAYDEARRVYNGMIDRRPALVVRATGAADVMAAVRFAGQHGLALAVRGGGHSVPGFGTCDDGIALDLGRMRGIRVDPQRRAARVEGGCTWGDVNHATYAFGLATTGGVVSTTGVGGLTLGGGLGYLARQCGLSCDNVLSADVVLADGRLLTCSEDEHADLFWAIRGGGGNFGVVTSFEFRLHTVADIVGGPTFYALDAEVLHRYRQFIAAAPERLGAVLGLTMAPPLPFLPAAWHGRPVAAVIACWTGSAGEAEKVLEPLGRLGRVLGRHVGPMPYPVINTLFDDVQPPGLQQYWKAQFLHELTDGAIAAHATHAADVPCVESGTFFFPLDGAPQRVPSDATAFAHRDAGLAVVISGAWPDPADTARNVEWVRRYDAAVRPFGGEAGYVNFMSADDGERVRANYGRNHERLQTLKRRYDPGNLFRLNHNIAP
jgi:FAD/FMN-containing dehydrogenase